MLLDSIPREGWQPRRRRLGRTRSLPTITRSTAIPDESRAPMTAPSCNPDFEYCFELRCQVDEALPLGGQTPGEGLHFARVSGGTFDGPRLQRHGAEQRRRLVARAAG